MGSEFAVPLKLCYMVFSNSMFSFLSSRSLTGFGKVEKNVQSESTCTMLGFG